MVIPISQLISDPDNDIDYSTILIEKSAQFGVVSLGVNPGELVYTPNAGFAGNDSFNYSIADATGLRSNISVISMQVSNEAPNADDDEFIINEDETSVLNVLGNDSDPQNNINPSSIIVVANPLNGSTNVNTENGTVVYTPNGDYNGTDFLIYRICDFTGYCDEARVDVTILPVNDAPLAVDDVRTLPEDNSVFIDVLTNDYDVDNFNDDLIIGISSQPINGKVQVVTDPDGIVYTPNLNYFGLDSFIYRLSDPDGLFSEATVKIGRASCRETV